MGAAEPKWLFQIHLREDFLCLCVSTHDRHIGQISHCYWKLALEAE